MAKRIKNTKIKIKIFIKPSNDPRSYRQNLTELLKRVFHLKVKLKMQF